MPIPRGVAYLSETWSAGKLPPPCYSRNLFYPVFRLFFRGALPFLLLMLSFLCLSVIHPYRICLLQRVATLMLSKSMVPRLFRGSRFEGCTLNKYENRSLRPPRLHRFLAVLFSRVPFVYSLCFASLLVSGFFLPSRGLCRVTSAKKWRRNRLLGSIRLLSWGRGEDAAKCTAHDRASYRGKNARKRNGNGNDFLAFFFLRMFTRSARLTYFLPFAAESFLAVFVVLERTLPASFLI